MHHLVRVVRRRILHHGDLIAKLSGKANSCLHACMCDEPDDDELMDAVVLELQVKVGVGEATGAPMLSRNDLTRLGYELGADLATPRVISEGLVHPRRLLNGRNVSKSRSRPDGIDDAAHRRP